MARSEAGGIRDVAGPQIGSVEGAGEICLCLPFHQQVEVAIQAATPFHAETGVRASAAILSAGRMGEGLGRRLSPWAVFVK